MATEYLSFFLFLIPIINKRINLSDKTIQNLKNKLEVKTKEAQFYKDQYRKTQLALDQSIKRKPINNCYCVPTQNIILKIDDIRKIRLIDSFEVETIKEYTENVHVIVLRDSKLKEYN